MHWELLIPLAVAPHRLPPFKAVDVIVFVALVCVFPNQADAKAFFYPPVHVINRHGPFPDRHCPKNVAIRFEVSVVVGDGVNAPKPRLSLDRYGVDPLSPEVACINSAVNAAG